MENVRRVFILSEAQGRGLFLLWDLPKQWTGLNLRGRSPHRVSHVNLMCLLCNWIVLFVDHKVVRSLTLYSQVLKAKYYPTKNLWEGKFRNGNSWFWRGCTSSLWFINDKLGCVLGNGGNISVWENNWIPSDGGLRKIVSPISNRNLIVLELWDDKGEWRENLIKKLPFLIQ